MIHTDDGVQCGIEDGARPSLFLDDRRFDSLASHELAELIANRGHRTEKVFVGVEDGLVEEFEHTDHFLADANRKREPAVQSSLSRR